MFSGGDSRLQTHKTRLHQKHHTGGDHNPNVVEVGLKNFELSDMRWGVGVDVHDTG